MPLTLNPSFSGNAINWLPEPAVEWMKRRLGRECAKKKTEDRTVGEVSRPECGVGFAASDLADQPVFAFLSDIAVLNPGNLCELGHRSGVGRGGFRPLPREAERHGPIKPCGGPSRGVRRVSLNAGEAFGGLQKMPRS
jgi:hypothetical protein